MLTRKSAVLAAMLAAAPFSADAARLRVETQGDGSQQLSLSGHLAREDVCSVAVAFASTVAPRRIVIDSLGGDALAGVRLGRIIAWSGAEVVVPAGGSAHSAAAVAVMGGARRSLHGDVGFHAPYFSEYGRPSAVYSSTTSGVISLGIRAEINMELENFLAESGMTKDAISHVMTTGPNALWRPGTAVLETFRTKRRADPQRLKRVAASCVAAKR